MDMSPRSHYFLIPHRWKNQCLFINYISFLFLYFLRPIVLLQIPLLMIILAFQSSLVHQLPFCSWFSCCHGPSSQAPQATGRQSYRSPAEAEAVQSAPASPTAQPTTWRLSTRELTRTQRLICWDKQWWIGECRIDNHPCLAAWSCYCPAMLVSVFSSTRLQWRHM